MKDVNKETNLHAILLKAVKDMGKMAADSPCSVCTHKGTPETGCFGGGHCKEFQWSFAEQVKAFLKEGNEALDMESVVRCNDCHHYEDGICKKHSALVECEYCHSWHNGECINGDEARTCGMNSFVETKPEDYCSYGTRKEQTDE